MPGKLLLMANAPDETTSRDEMRWDAAAYSSAVFSRYWPQPNLNVAVLCPNNVLVYCFCKDALILLFFWKFFFFCPVGTQDVLESKSCCLLHQRATKFKMTPLDNLTQHMHASSSHWQQCIFGPMVIQYNAHQKPSSPAIQLHFIVLTNLPNTHPSTYHKSQSSFSLCCSGAITLALSSGNAFV